VKAIKKILIANRGEIAVRIIRSCKELSIETVGIYTESEKDLPHANICDVSISLGKGPLKDTYLNHDLLLAHAIENKVDAIHPGYGFLSENAVFAKKVTASGIKFIGPSPEVMTLMGDKKESKISMEKISIPIIPGFHGDEQEPDFLLKEATKIGTPLLIKASAGGGGKGMRVVEDLNNFNEQLNSAKREAMNAFGDDRVLLERYITKPRHIEVQLMSDQHGNHLHFFERECSIQRRHQKILEETPSPALDCDLRQRMCETATKISKHINYEGAGTIEYILDTDGSFYFLEMNTRLQVEHPITEMVTDCDLVKLQIQVASGEELSLKQKDITQKGHAIEARYYAEDPDNDFMPAIGTIKQIGNLISKNARLDTGYRAGNSVTIDFDPMCAKLIVWEKDRNLAIISMLSELDGVTFFGLKTNREYLSRILKHTAFKAGETFTNFVFEYKDELRPESFKEEELALILASAHFAKNTQIRPNLTARSNYDVWGNLKGFRNT
jgi:3-methylcrotonyl-CoA carboxylase alpha subunit